MKDILHQAKKIASSDKCVVIVGEYGSGKSWLAQEIHKLGKRCDKPFMSVDCRILEEYEASERLFGYLTHTPFGARISHGIFEQTKGGTIFFECFNSLPEHIQQAVIKTETSALIQRIGSNRKVEIDQPRLICSLEIRTNHEDRQTPLLTDIILTNDPFIIGQPPLRQRRDDIPSLINNFLHQQLKRRPDICTKSVSPEVIYQCIQYDWPGNVKQLKNAIEHAAITSEEDIISLKDLPLSIKAGQANHDNLKLLENSQSYKNAETKLIKNILDETQSIEHAAKVLGVNQQLLLKKIEKLKLPTKSKEIESNFLQ